MNSEVGLKHVFTFHMTRRRFNALLGICSVSACTKSLVKKPVVPAMWLARSGTARIYLFGQMPVPSGTIWLTPGIETAFLESDALWIENPDYAQQSTDIVDAVNELNKSRAAPPDYSVLTVLDDERRRRLIEVLRAEGLDPGTLNGRSLADVHQYLSFIRDRDTGADFEAVPESVFRNRAVAIGKTVLTEWRDLLEVVQWGTDMPAVQMELVEMTLDELDQDYASELSSWLRGDLDGQREKAESRASRYPELYRHINIERNRAMVERLLGASAEFEQQFVCVGIYHLVGPGSIPEFIQDAGLNVQRV